MSTYRVGSENYTADQIKQAFTDNGWTNDPYALANAAVEHGNVTAKQLGDILAISSGNEAMLGDQATSYVNDYVASKMPGYEFAADGTLQMKRQAPVQYRETSPYVSPGDYQRLSDGDYEALQKSLYEGAIAGLTNQEKTWREQSDQGMANRGIWSSGIAERSQNDISEKLAPMYTQAGANAAATRYGMEQADNQGASNYNLQSAGMENNYNLTNAQNYNNWAQGMYGLQNQYALGNKTADDNYALQRAQMLNTANAQAAQSQWQSQWEPATYLAGLWNGTGGVISNSSSGGFNI